MGYNSNLIKMNITKTYLYPQITVNLLQTMYDGKKRTVKKRRVKKKSQDPQIISF